MRSYIKISVIIYYLLIAVPSNAQWEFRDIIVNDNITYPETSKKASISNTIGITEVKIDYHSPAVRNRIVFGGLVPFGKVWRAGANESTTITFQDDVLIQNRPLNRGIYGLHIIPNKEEWTVIFSKNHTQWGSFYYNEDEDVLRISVKPETILHQEFLQYDFTSIEANKVDLELKWSTLKVAFTISVNEVATTMAVIKDELRTLPRFSWRGNREAALFLWLHDSHLHTAMELIERSIDYERRFENVYLKALIYKSLGDKENYKVLLNEAVDLGNENKFMYVIREALGHHNSPEKCFELLDIASIYFPKSYQVNLLRGRAYGWLGEMEDAKMAFVKALSLAHSEREKRSVNNEMELFGIKI